MECNTNVDFLNRERMLTEKDSAPGSEHGMQFLLQQNNKKIAPFNAKESKHSVELCTEGMTTVSATQSKPAELSVTLEGEDITSRGIGLMSEQPPKNASTATSVSTSIAQENQSKYKIARKKISTSVTNLADAAAGLKNALTTMSHFLTVTDFDNSLHNNTSLASGDFFVFTGLGENGPVYKLGICDSYVIATLHSSSPSQLTNSDVPNFLVGDEIVGSTGKYLSLSGQGGAELDEFRSPDNITFPTANGNAWIPIVPSGSPQETCLPRIIEDNHKALKKSLSDLSNVETEITGYLQPQLTYNSQLDSSFSQAVSKTNKLIRKNGIAYVQHLIASNKIDNSSAIEEDRKLNMISNSYHYFAWCTVAVLMVAVTVKIAE